MSDSRREFIQIEAGEDANSVRDRLSFIRGKRVLLIWPEEGTALTRKLDLVLIQREAMRRAIRLALVTHDADVIRHATELNISTFETIGASERGRWKRGRAKVFTSRFQRPKDDPEPGELMDVASRVRIKRPSLSKLQNFALRTVILVALIGVVLAVAYVVIPGATITLTPAQQVIEATVDIAVSTDVTRSDIENAILPATRLGVEIEERAAIDTTGTQTLEGERAVGSVIFINEIEQEIDIPAGTTVSTSAGTPISFRTTEGATLPAGDGQEVEVPIEAMGNSSGDVGNVGENLINTVVGPLENSVTVRNLAPTTGGATRTANVATEDDRERLIALMRQQLQEKAFTEMLAETSDTQMVIIETLRIVEERDDWTTFSHEVGEVTDTLSLTKRARVEALVVDEQLARQIVFAHMGQQVLRGRAIQLDTVEFERGPVAFDNEGGITFTMTGRGHVAGQINREQLQNQLAGRSLEYARDYLLTRVDLADGTTPEIRLSPDWFDQMPILPMRITVQVQESS